MNYVELRCKSNFSFLTGASHPEELVQTAIDSGLGGIAITDLDGVYGMPRGYKIARNHSNFKYICGTEMSFTDHPNITLIARSRKDYALICQLVTLAKKDKDKGHGFLSLAEMIQFLNFHTLIAIPRFDPLGTTKGLPQWGLLKSVFTDSLFLPLTFYLDGHDPKRIRLLKEIKTTFQIPWVATNDVEYHVKKRKLVQDVLISIRENKPLSEIGFKIRPNGERYLKSPEQMAQLYIDFPEALANTLKIAESCHFSPQELTYRYPSEWIPESYTGQSYLEHLVWTQAPERYPLGVNDKIKQQLNHELKLISELNFADYFLTIYDVVQFARSKYILCQGRGSAANSAVCYVLGITAIDPIQMNLLFERFISAERGEPPDIDIDFEHERREEVIQYIYEKYGRHRAAMISAVVTYQYRSSFRETCKALGVPVGTLSAKKVQAQFDELIKDHPQKENLRTKIDYIAREIQGFPRHLSIHSGGFTLSADPMTDIVPVEPARLKDRTIIQWDKYDLDTLGLIKVDILALGMLTCLNKVLNLVNKKLYEIPHEDAATYAMIQNCDTVGTFQIESRAQMSMLGRLKPSTFYDLVIEVAIVRPGPIVGKMVHPFLRRRQGLEPISFPNEKVKSILGKTLGVPLFQEQVMKLAIELAGFTPGEADKLRKTINAWRSSSPIGVMGDRLRQGLLNTGLSESFADQIFQQIQGFSHYGFPESHAASFALIAYASCYLKCHHPAEFACALINSQPMGFYRTDTILYDAIRHGVTVLPVSILHSDWDCQMCGPKTFRLGFRVVKGLARSHFEELKNERARMGFVSLSDFLNRSRLRKDIVHRLALAGRLSQKLSARDALWSILELENLMEPKTSGQLSLFTDYVPQNLPGTHSQIFSPLSAFEKIQNDYSAFNVSLNGHPMKEFRTIYKAPRLNSKSMRQLPSGHNVKIAGLVLVRQKPPTANGTCFSTLEDEFGFIDIVLFPKIYEQYKSIYLSQCFLTISGRMEKSGNTITVLVSHVEAMIKAQAPTFELAANQKSSTPPASSLYLEPDQYFWGN